MKKEQDYYDSFDEKRGNGCCIYVSFLSIYIYIEKKGSKLSDDFVPSKKTKEQLMDEYVIKNKIKEQQLEQVRRYQANAQAQELLNKPKCPDLRFYKHQKDRWYRAWSFNSCIWYF